MSNSATSAAVEDENKKEIAEGEDVLVQTLSWSITHDKEINIQLKAVLPNCCSICEERCEEKELSDADKLLNRMCENLDFHRLSLPGGRRREQNDIKYLMDLINFIVDKRGQKPKRYCNNCIVETIKMHAKKSSSYRAEDDGQVFLKCPFCTTHCFITEELLKGMPPDVSKAIQQSLEREFMMKNYVFAFCPILKCTFMQTFGLLGDDDDDNEIVIDRIQSLNEPQPTTQKEPQPTTQKEPQPTTQKEPQPTTENSIPSKPDQTAPTLAQTNLPSLPAKNVFELHPWLVPTLIILAALLVIAIIIAIVYAVRNNKKKQNISVQEVEKQEADREIKV